MVLHTAGNVLGLDVQYYFSYAHSVWIFPVDLITEQLDAEAIQVLAYSLPHPLTQSYLVHSSPLYHTGPAGCPAPGKVEG